MTDRNEWLQWRLKGIGSSDAPCIHGASPYKTRYDLWVDKTQETYVEKEAGFVAMIGNELEPIARKKFAALWSIEHFADENFEPRRLEMSSWPFMRASLDGASKDCRVIVEFKFQSKPKTIEEQADGHMTPGKQAHLNVLNESLPITSATGEQARTPFHYWIQMQHQLLVSGADVCHFASFDGESLHTCEVFPDVEWMKTHLALCEEFWKLVETKTPPPFTDDDFKELRVKGGKALIQQWKRYKVLLDETQSQIDEIEDQIRALTDKPRLHCDGVYIIDGKFGVK